MKCNYFSICSIL